MTRYLLIIVALAHVAMGAIGVLSGSSGAPRISSAATDLPSNWTVAFWFSFTGNLPNGSDQDVYPLWSRSTNSHVSPFPPLCHQFIAAIPSSAPTHIYIDRAWAGRTTWTPILASTFTLADHNWHHVLVTHVSSTNTWTLYIDGSLDSSAVNSSAQDSSCTFDFNLIGSDSGLDLEQCGDGFFPRQCNFAEAAAWSRVLNAGEIKALAEGTSPSLMSGPMLYYWPFYNSPLNVSLHLFGDQSGNGWGASAVSQPEYVNHCPGCSMPTGEEH